MEQYGTIDGSLDNAKCPLDKNWILTSHEKFMEQLDNTRIISINGINMSGL